MNTGPATRLLAQATTLLGPLDSAARDRIRALLVDPGVDTWDAAHSLVINGNSLRLGTMWQAVRAVDQRCPQAAGTTGTAAERWHGYYPDPFTVLRALREAIPSPPQEES